MALETRIFLTIVAAFLVAGCADAGSDNWLDVTTNQYVVIARHSHESGSVEYAALKLTKQGDSAEDVIVYEWISLEPGAFTVSVDTQNFKAGTKRTVGRFGIGFEGYRLLWAPLAGVGAGRVRSIWHGVKGTRYCLSDYSEVWGRNLHDAMEELEAIGRCQG